VRAGSVQRETLVTSLILAGALVAGADLAGQMLLGVGLGAGLILGSINGFIIQETLDRGAPVLASSFLRLAFFTLLALVVARLLGGSVWPVAIGIGVAQLVMVGVGVRQGRRA
jgi:hypothetical protein